MKRVTRDIDPDDARDLLERVPRACIAFATDHGPQAQPVTLVWQGSRYFVGLPDDAQVQPGDGDEVVLLVDEGLYFFDLRAIYIRGRAQPAAAPNEAVGGYTWFEVMPTKSVAWDYGMMREADDEG